MLPALQSLVNAATSVSAQPADSRQLLYAYLLARTAGMPTDYKSLQSLVANFPGFNQNDFLNTQIVQLAKNLGLSTDGATLVNLSRQTMVGPGSQLNPAGVNAIIQYAELKRLGAAL